MNGAASDRPADQRRGSGHSRAMPDGDYDEALDEGHEMREADRLIRGGETEGSGSAELSVEKVIQVQRGHRPIPPFIIIRESHPL